MQKSSIATLIKMASEAYYDGSPILSNEEYDALEQIHGQIIGGHGEIQHAHRMFSLQKHYDKDGEPPLAVSKCCKTPKLDGAAVSLQYNFGGLTLGLTRGDGIKGRDITEKMSWLVSDMVQCLSKYPLVQITGEVVASSSVENSRNYASGALNLKDMDEFIARVRDGEMIFVAYDVIGINEDFETYQEKLDHIKPEFTVITEGNFDKYPTDGIVYRLNSEAEYKSLGHTSKFPRGAFAWKEEQDHVETTLLEVIWQTGKSGKVTPVAILEPVKIGDATVSRATLNNIAYIEALSLTLGCRVKVIRSGEIIPKIIGRAD